MYFRYASQNLAHENTPQYYQSNSNIRQPPAPQQEQWERDSIVSASKEREGQIPSAVMADHKGFTRRPMTRVCIALFIKNFVVYRNSKPLFYYLELESSFRCTVPCERIGLYEFGSCRNGCSMQDGRTGEPALSIARLYHRQ